MSGITREYCQSYILTAGECNAQGIMPVTLFGARVIEVATFHANELGVGYDRLIADGLAWVLSRLSIEMYRSPKVNERYTLRTWIEGFNRHFSERDFEMTDSRGEVIGHARSIWMAINIKERCGADLAMLEPLRASVSDRVCPIEKMPRLTALSGDGVQESVYRFRYCDCDFNRHVNTLRYMELLLNQWDMAFFDSHVVRRFDIAFMHEAKFGEEALVRVLPIADGCVYLAEICGDEGCYSRGRIQFVDYHYEMK